jgi:hypothetical protein
MTLGLQYIREAIAAHPFNFCTLVFATAALIVSLRALSVSRTLAAATLHQADEAKRSRELSERALAAQSEALKAHSEQAAEMIRHSERSAAAAEKSAAAAQAIALSNVEVQRATMVVRSIDGIAHDPRRVPRAARTTLMNTGKATACYMHVHQRMEICTAFPIAPPIPETWSTLQPANIGAGIEYDVYTEGPTLPTMAEVWEGLMFMCVYGVAKYEDFRGHRTLSWCYAWDVRQQLWYTAGPLNKVT